MLVGGGKPEDEPEEWQEKVGAQVAGGPLVVAVDVGVGTTAHAKDKFTELSPRVKFTERTERLSRRFKGGFSVFRSSVFHPFLLTFAKYS